MADDSWNLCGLQPAGFGIVNLKILSGFLSSAAGLPAERVSNFGPTKSELLQLRCRLLGVQEFTGTKAVLFSDLGMKVDELISQWPPSATAPALAQHADFWTALAADIAEEEAPAPEPYPSVLLKLDDFRGSAQDLIDTLKLEAAAIHDLDAIALKNLRPRLAITFGTLAQRPIPDSIADVVVQRAAINFIMKKLKACQAALAARQATLSASASPAPHVPTATRVPPIPAVTSTRAPATLATTRINSLAHNFDHLLGHLQHSGLVDLAVPPAQSALPARKDVQGSASGKIFFPSA